MRGSWEVPPALPAATTPKEDPPTLPAAGSTFGIAGRRPVGVQVPQ